MNEISFFLTLYTQYPINGKLNKIPVLPFSIEIIIQNNNQKKEITSAFLSLLFITIVLSTLSQKYN